MVEHAFFSDDSSDRISKRNNGLWTEYFHVLLHNNSSHCRLNTFRFCGYAYKLRRWKKSRTIILFLMYFIFQTILRQVQKDKKKNGKININSADILFSKLHVEARRTTVFLNRFLLPRCVVKHSLGVIIFVPTND